MPLDQLASVLARGGNFFAEFKAGCLPSALMHPEMGDEALHLHLMQTAIRNIEEQTNPQNGSTQRKDVKPTKSNQAERSTIIETQLRGIALLQGIARRRLYKVGISINATQFGRLTKGASPEAVVEERLKRMLTMLRDDLKSKNLRARLEGEMATAAGMPPETILMYVPPRKSQAKGIETFAFDKDGVVMLSEHPAVSEKVNELSRDYKNLWRLIVLTHPGYQDRIVEFSEAIDILVTALWSEFGSQASDIDLNDETRISTIREISRSIYIRKDHREPATRMRRMCEGLPTQTRMVNWDLFERGPIATTETQETLSSIEYAERGFLLQCLIDYLPRTKRSERIAISIIKAHFPQPDARFSYKNLEAEMPAFRDRWAGKESQLSRADRQFFIRAFELEKLAESMHIGWTKGRRKKTDMADHLAS